MEVLILHYYLKVFNIIIITIFINLFFYSYYSLNKNIFSEEKIITINKGSNFNNVFSQTNINHNFLDNIIYKIYYRILILLSENTFIHYGSFKIEKNQSFVNFIDLISKPSNVLNKITIIEGWSKNQLNQELSKYFDDYKSIAYEEILADTYYVQKNQNFDIFLNKLKNYKNNYIKNKRKELNYNAYTDYQIMIIGSLIEREGLDYEDKLKISSVISNRLENKMKLQIDASVVYFITEGKNNLKRNLTYSDLKIKNPYNTYIINGLPPKPIAYVGTKTIDIILERYKSDFLFYFFNNVINKHIFSEDYEKHKYKLNEYRKNK